jgi:hypothetical protein
MGLALPARNSTVGQDSSIFPGKLMTEHSSHKQAPDSSQERVVVAYTAGTAAEAMVVRGLLESAGISSPGSVSNDPFPLRESPEGTHGVEVYVLEPRAEEARKLIAEYQKGNQSSAEPEE